MTTFFSKIHKLIVFIITLSVAATSISARDFVVIIDAGHGGYDGGAIGLTAKEKDINLAVAKLLGEKIKSGCNNVKVVYTRTTDKFVSLQQRANIANKAGGDLFISIHVNSLDKDNPKRTEVSGASVFTLGLHKTQDNLDVAKRENSVIELEQDFSTIYSGFDPNSTESYIIFEMNQNKHMLQSIEFAGAVQKELTSTSGRADRGVRQAGFWVLWATSMPSILIELDFICNPTQEQFLSSSEGQDKLATSIYNAFKKYHSSYSKHIKDEKVADKPKQNTKQKSKATQQQSSKNKNDNKQSQNNSSTQNSKTNNTIVPEITSTTNNNEIEYRIQILTSDKNLKNNSKEFKGLTPIYKYRDGGIWKYTYICTKSLEEAQKALSEVQQIFPKAFIIKFKNGKRIK